MLGPKQGPKPTEDDLEALEGKAGFQIPDDYKAFMMECDGVAGGPWEIAIPGFDDLEVVAGFYSFGDPHSDIHRRLRLLQRNEGVEGILPIAWDDFNNLYAICVVKDQSKSIVFFDRENGSSYIVCDTFTEFLGMLRPPEEDIDQDDEAVASDAGSQPHVKLMRPSDCLAERDKVAPAIEARIFGVTDEEKWTSLVFGLMARWPGLEVVEGWPGAGKRSFVMSNIDTAAADDFADAMQNVPCVFACIAERAELDFRNEITRNFPHGHFSVAVGQTFANAAPGLFWRTFISGELADRLDIQLPAISRFAIGAVWRPDGGLWVRLYDHAADWREHVDTVDDYLLGALGLFSWIPAYRLAQEAASPIEMTRVLERSECA
ncbi:SMI1/KNR4 family protein [Pinirhizobacter soli]|uniref:SMI1/KNR4 family protein n=1 Tax=Pinirhizobacter soli TaxID=2786953 RepID=UPI00202A2FB5|nr:SMI1/KNR4 family protein [Pinirhizobacter soli]